MARMGLQTAKRLRNGAVTLVYGHGGPGLSIRTVTAGGELTVGQVARLVGTYNLRVWRAVKKKTLKARKAGGQYLVTVKEAGRWERALKAGG